MSDEFTFTVYREGGDYLVGMKDGEPAWSTNPREALTYETRSSAAAVALALTTLDGGVCMATVSPFALVDQVPKHPRPLAGDPPHADPLAHLDPFDVREPGIFRVGLAQALEAFAFALGLPSAALRWASRKARGQ